MIMDVSRTPYVTFDPDDSAIPLNWIAALYGA
jgi:hypothetical protein